MNTWPKKWGFEGDLRKCIGKTLLECHPIKMPWGCTWNEAWAVRFTDGTRAFFVGGVGSGCVSPSFEEVEQCPVFTAEEVGEYATSLRREREDWQRRDKEKKKQQLEQLRKELGEA